MNGIRRKKCTGSSCGGVKTETDYSSAFVDCTPALCVRARAL